MPGIGSHLIMSQHHVVFAIASNGLPYWKRLWSFCKQNISKTWKSEAARRHAPENRKDASDKCFNFRQQIKCEWYEDLRIFPIRYLLILIASNNNHRRRRKNRVSGDVEMLRILGSHWFLWDCKKMRKSGIWGVQEIFGILRPLTFAMFLGVSSNPFRCLSNRIHTCRTVSQCPWCTWCLHFTSNPSW